MQAMTFDFYGTLVYHRAGVGRGRRYREYLAAVGLTTDPWEHRVLYDVFEYYGERYRPALDEGDKRSFWVEFTRRLFERTSVRGAVAVDPADHATAIREIMGPSCLALFDDALPVLRALRDAGLRLGVISDWQKGLTHFCEELGIGGYFDVVVASAETGHEKPDPRLFEVARAGLDLPAGEILHVGDRVEDVAGALGAGMRAALLVRSGAPPAVDAPVVENLRALLSM